MKSYENQVFLSLSSMIVGFGIGTIITFYIPYIFITLAILMLIFIAYLFLWGAIMDSYYKYDDTSEFPMLVSIRKAFKKKEKPIYKEVTSWRDKLK